MRFLIVLLLNRRNSWPPQPTGRKKSTRKRQALPLVVDHADVTVLGQVESGKGDISEKCKTPSKKKKSSHKSPSKKSSKAGKSADFQSDLKNLDDKWLEHFAQLEAMFLARSFTVPVEPVQKADVVVTDRPFISPVQQTTGLTSQKQTAGAAGQMEMKKATQ